MIPSEVKLELSPPLIELRRTLPAVYNDLELTLRLAAARESNVPVPAPHSAAWAPDREPTLKAAIRAEVTALLELFASPK